MTSCFCYAASDDGSGSFANARENQVVSPDGQLEVNIKLVGKQPFYSVSYNGKAVLLESALGVVFESDPFEGGFEVIDTQSISCDSTWEMVWGQNKTVRDHYNQTTIKLRELGKLKRKLDVIFRAYDDGIAYRYHWPKQKDMGDIKIASELSSFHFAGNHQVWRAASANGVSGPVELNSFKLTFSPVTVKVSDSCYVSLHEANVGEYEVFKLSRHGDNTLRVNVTANSAAGKSSSWRTMQIAKDPAGLIESQLILNLNEPCAIEDTSWIEPEVSLWDWRVHGAVVTDGDGSRFTYGLSTESEKRMIDAAARLGVKYHLIDAEWYGNERSVKSDPTTWEAVVDVPYLAKYAESKGVGLWLYMNDRALKNFDMDKTFALFQKWGVKGIKHGFPREKQFFCHKVVRKCAEYKLMYNCHEPLKPTGYRRTYPNYMTREFINSQLDGPRRPAASPTVVCSFPFVHCLGGPLDRSPGMFSLNTMKARDKCHKEIPSTVASQVAQCLVIPSGIVIIEDHGEAYEAKLDLFEFIAKLPLSWDRTKVINADIGKFITVARQSGEQWFVSSLTNESGRSLTVDLDFLEDGIGYDATFYEDAADASYINNKEAYRIRKMNVKKGDSVSVTLAPGGGNSIWIRPQK
jgi:alpha-glucosidase